MKKELARLGSCLLRPQAGFAALAARRPRMRESLARLLALRLPLGFLHAWLAGRAFLRAWAELRNPYAPAWRQALNAFPGAPSLEDLKGTLAALPPAPAWERCWPWLLLLVPLGLLGLWLHDAAWDHAGLWLLRGLKPEKAGRVSATLNAEAEALAVGSVGVLVGVLGFIPYLGSVFGLLGLPLGVYLWCLRGVALAAFHGCPTWKGVVATLLHVLLFGLFACLLLGLVWVLMMALLGSVGSVG